MGFPLSGQCEVGHFGGSAMATSCDARAKLTRPEPRQTPGEVQSWTDFGRFSGFERLSVKCSPTHSRMIRFIAVNESRNSL